MTLKVDPIRKAIERFKALARPLKEPTKEEIEEHIFRRWDKVFSRLAKND